MAAGQVVTYSTPCRLLTLRRCAGCDGIDLQIIEAPLNAAARGRPFGLCHMGSLVPKSHAIGQGTFGSIFSSSSGAGRGICSARIGSPEPDGVGTAALGAPGWSDPFGAFA